MIFGGSAPELNIWQAPQTMGTCQLFLTMTYVLMHYRPSAMDFIVSQPV
jgi:hypothetical protein